jgi:hypothetical protein
LTLQSKSPFEIPLYQKHGDSMNAIKLENEIGVGQEVTIAMESFKPKNAINMGQAIGAILFPEGPIKAYTGAGGAAIAAFGLDVDNSQTTPELEIVDEDKTETESPFGSTSTEAPAESTTSAFSGDNPFA